MRLRVVWTVVIIVIVLVVIGLMRFNLSALQKPGHVETLVANQSKRFFIERASHQGIPPRVHKTSKASISGRRYLLRIGLQHLPQRRRTRRRAAGESGCTRAHLI